MLPCSWPEHSKFQEEGFQGTERKRPPEFKKGPERTRKGLGGPFVENLLTPKLELRMAHEPHTTARRGIPSDSSLDMSAVRLQSGFVPPAANPETSTNAEDTVTNCWPKTACSLPPSCS